MRSMLAVATLAMISSSAFAACDPKLPPGDPRSCGKAARPAPKRFEPYDPDRMKAGSRPGFVDVGGGTEVRVSGRSRVEYQYSR